MKLKVQELKLNYGTKTVLENISAIFEEGSINGIVGLNGSGKTTFYNALQGTIQPVRGVITYNNVSLLKNQIAFLETHNYFYSYITGREYLDLFEQKNEVLSKDQTYDLFDLPLDSLIETYSTGMKKKLALMALLKKDVPIYMFDEPYNGLDLESCKIVDMVLSYLKENKKIILISSHIIDPLTKISDKVFLLHKGFFTEYLPNQYAQIEDLLFGEVEQRISEILYKG